ncbi:MULTISPECIES: TolC family protein [unclassified Ensifer]|uniref:TolC family protein n=1 Tax=unclassified Ensifer TaxID=2633371 RepID=UPI000A47994C|nr:MULTISPECIES: TolC family protein [unclassified Ensifer]
MLRAARSLLLVGALCVPVACTSSALDDLAPPSADKPAATGGNTTAPTSTTGKPDFALAPDPAIPITIATPTIDPKHAYTLPELIDIAQLTNPVTRAAWQRARQAAIAVGIAEAVYLPILTADVLAGVEQTSATAPGIPGPIPVSPGTLTTTGAQFIPSLTVKWLLLDFGGRDAGREAATQLSHAANVTFNGTHQKLIFDVSNAYFILTAARVQLKIARQTLQNAELVQEAAKARMGRGLATSIETAQANQQVAQARFNLTQSQGHERSAYMTLLEAVGVSPTLDIRIADGSDRALPKAVPQDLDRLIATSLQRRPDVQAAFARLQADRNGIAAARAEFMPKVALVGNVNRNIGSLSVDDSRFDLRSTIRVNQPNANLMIGLSVPIFDGGLRDARLQSAIAQAGAAEQEMAQLQNTAAREVVVAYDLLRTSLAGHAAASELTRAAQTTYDAAVVYYKQGLGTITDVSIAQSALLQAKVARATAYSDALVAAATLAFATGTLTNRDAVGRF